jgi:uncharacterized protein
MKSSSNPWREPMVWLVFGIPAVTLLAAIALIVILVRSDSTEDVAHPTQESPPSRAREMAPGLPPP